MTENVSAPKKKGNASWKPKEEVQVEKQLHDPNYRYRYVAADDYRITTLIGQGWELCTALNGERTFKGTNGATRVIAGTSLDTVVGDRDRVLMRLPIEGAQKRDAHYEEKAKRLVKGVAADAKNKVGKTMKGDIRINGDAVNEIID